MELFWNVIAAIAVGFILLVIWMVGSSFLARTFW